MGLFSREKFLLVNIETKETVYEDKEFIAKETVLEEIEKENQDPGLYRLERWSGGRKVRNEWVMRKPKKKQTAEEIAAKGREEAEAYIQQKAIDIKKDVEDYQTFVTKIRKMYDIEGADNVGSIKIPTGKDGNLGIMEAFNLAIAESTYEGVRATKPAEVAAAVKSVMDSGTTILAGVAQMLTARMMDSNKPKVKKEPEVKKELEKKPAPKKEEEKKVNHEPKIRKEVISEGITRTSFTPERVVVTMEDEDITSTLLEKEPDLYIQYKRDMTGSIEEEAEKE